jgi:hypothetical protein
MNRHAITQRRNQLVRFGRDDSAAFDRLAGGRFPFHPQLHHYRELMVGANEREGLLITLSARRPSAGRGRLILRNQRDPADHKGGAEHAPAT